MRKLLLIAAGLLATVGLVSAQSTIRKYPGTTFSTTSTSMTFTTIDGTSAGVYPLKALTAGAATPVVLISVASGAAAGGAFEYSIFVGDATPNYQVRHGSINFAVVNKAGTETCTVGSADETADGSVIALSSGGADTLTYGITCVTTPTNGVYLSVNAVSSLTETSLNIRPRVNLDCSVSGACSVTPQ